MSLYDYLTKYFPSGASGVFEDTKVDLISHFFDKFGVNVKTEGNLYQFKYDQLAAKFSFPLVSECRGHIWSYSDRKWKRVCTPPDKFFNQHEGYCPLFNEDEFKKRLSSLSAIRKEDGTAIPIWYDVDASSWRASTLGAITPFKVGDYDITFDRLFWETFGDENKHILEQAGNKDVTYLFELCCMENRIVTKYRENKVFLLTARNNKTGVYETPSWWGVFKCEQPDFYLLNSLDITSLDQLKKWVDDNSIDSDSAEFREGFVVYDSLTPIAKIKTARYLTLHAVGGGDMKHTRNVVIDSFFTGCLDDIWAVLHPQMQEFAETLKTKVIELKNQALVSAKDIDVTTITSQKDYALWVKGNVAPQFHGFFFSNKEKVLCKENINELFTWWIKSNYKKFENFWKD